MGFRLSSWVVALRCGVELGWWLLRLVMLPPLVAPSSCAAPSQPISSVFCSDSWGKAAVPATPSVRSLVAHSLPASVCSAHPSASGAASALRVPSACSVQVRAPESLGSFPVKRRLSSEGVPENPKNVANARGLAQLLNANSEDRVWTCPICQIRISGKGKQLSSLQSHHLHDRHPTVDPRTVYNLRQIANHVDVSYDLPAHLQGWRCPWCGSFAS